MSVEQALREYNKERTTEGLIALSTGVFFTLLVFGFVFLMAWVGGAILSNLVGLKSIHIALIATGIFLLVAIWSAWRSVDPLEHVNLKHSPEEQAIRNFEVKLGYRLGGVPVIRRETLAWTGTILIGAPAAILEGVSLLKSRLRAGTETVMKAELLLADCSRAPQALSRMTDTESIVLLHRLGLARAQPGTNNEMVLVPTEKGRRGT